jgi:hypothetical protein
VEAELPRAAPGAGVSASALQEQARRDKKRIRELEHDLRYKEKALDEMAALLVLGSGGKGEDE